MGIGENKTYKILHTYLEQVGVRINRKTLKDALNKHPFKNSIRGISDILDEMKVEHIVCQLKIEQLSELQLPFMVVSTTENDPLCIVNMLTSSGL